MLRRLPLLPPWRRAGGSSASSSSASSKLPAAEVRSSWLRSLPTSCWSWRKSAPYFFSTGFQLMRTSDTMDRARWAYLSVLRVSSKDDADGEQCAIIAVRVFPPRESLSRRVSFESR